jgi:hypothetical protein
MGTGRLQLASRAIDHAPRPAVMVRASSHEPICVGGRGEEGRLAVPSAAIRGRDLELARRTERQCEKREDG